MSSNVHVALTVLEPLSRGDWAAEVAGGLQELGLSVEPLNGRVAAWGGAQSHKGIKYADGWMFSRMWLAPRRWALSITQKRMYFDGAALIHKPEAQIVGDSRPAGRAAAAEIVAQWDLLRRLADRLPGRPAPVQLSGQVDDLAAAREIWIGEQRHPFQTGTLNSLYRGSGFDAVPTGWTITLCGLDGVSPSVIAEFRRRLAQAAAQRQAELSVRESRVEEILGRIQQLNAIKEPVRRGRCVLFVLSRRDQPPSASAAQLFDVLDRTKVPFRRAYATDALEFSIPDQLPSLLLACGGCPHRAVTQARCGPVWTLAVDLGHHPARNYSVVVATLVDPSGRLVHASRMRQPRDETVSREAVARLLADCGTAAEFRSAREPNVLVLRDGRLFENEDVGLYTSSLGGRVSLLEYRKRWNPQVVLGNDEPRVPGGEFSAVLTGCCTMFVCSCRPRSSMALPELAKVTWRETWNQLGLSTSELGRLLAGSATAPGLGMHPRQWPAPLYWADGIAGTSELDLRFRGIPCEDVGDVEGT